MILLDVICEFFRYQKGKEKKLLSSYASLSPLLFKGSLA